MNKYCIVHRANSNCSLEHSFLDLEWRQIDIEERNYLKDVGVVTEMQCDLGRYRYKSYSIQRLMRLVGYLSQGMLALELSSHSSDIPNYAYMLISHILIGWYWKIMRRQLYTLTCPVPLCSQTLFSWLIEIWKTAILNHSNWLLDSLAASMVYKLCLGKNLGVWCLTSGWFLKWFLRYRLVLWAAT